MTCEDCFAEIMSYSEWRALPPEEKPGRRLSFGAYCRRCYDRRRRPRVTWPLADLIEEAEFLFLGGADVASVAFRLGLKRESLVRQYRRARERGLTDRIVDYRRTE